MPAKTSQPNVKIVRFDWATKSLLRDKANFGILEGFLQSLLDEKLEIVEILESEGNAESEQAKYNRVDLLAKDSQGRRVLVEIQNERESDYIERMLFGCSKLVVESIGIGQAYRDIPKVISIHILYFNLGQGTDYVYSGTTELRGVHTDEPLLVSERFTKPDGTHGYQPQDVWPEYHVSHSISGHFAIRQGVWKLCLAAGSGGWSLPREKDAQKQGLPPMQLFNLANDKAEQKNLIDAHPERVQELLKILKREVDNGRCTPGAKIPNDREITFLPKGVTIE